MKGASTTSAPPSDTMNELFAEAMKSYERALKSGIQLQEESVKLWKDLLSRLGSPEEFQKRLEKMSADALPEARKRMEEFVESFTKSSTQTIDLIGKAMRIPQSSSIAEAQARLQDLMESSLGAMRSSVHSALATNAKVMSSWKDLVEKVSWTK